MRRVILFSEQKMSMEIGTSYIVYIYVDPETHRIVASAKVERYLSMPRRGDYYRGRHVDVLIWQKSPIGFKVIIDNAYAGMLYDDQTYGNYHTGDRLDGTVVQLRSDGRLDVAEGRIGRSRYVDFAQQLEDELRACGGTLPFGDASDPDDIAERFHVSKKTFKRALGQLYRAQKVVLTPNSVTLKS